MDKFSPVGIFDSGYGGLTVFRPIIDLLPSYDYLYLGDNGRAPYGNKPYETVYRYTLECVKWFFDKGCRLVILACNTASAKALRTIQQKDLPMIAPDNRVLGVIRPTAEVIGAYTRTRHIGVLGTKGTINSGSYKIEINKFFPDIQVHQVACPMWVPLVENGEYNSDGADYFVKKYLQQLLSGNSAIDAIVLACTHYPLLMNKINKFLPAGIDVLAQGSIVAHSLADYLKRHPEIERTISRNATAQFYTTADTADFDTHATTFFGQAVTSHLALLS